MTKKLHILFLCGWYPSRVLPTNGDFIQRHAEAVSLLHKVSVLHIISDENCTKNIQIVSKEVNGVQTHIGYVKKSLNPIVKAIRFYKAYKRILQQVGNFDIIHLNELFPFGMFTFLQKKPFIVTEHWTGYHEPQSKNIGFWQRYLSKKIVKRAYTVCPVSKNLKMSMEQLGLQGSYNIVPNVVDTDLFFPTEVKKNLKFNILHISNMIDAHKNTSGLLEAVAKITFDYTLTLIGEKSSKYKTLIDTLNITKKVNCIEHLPHSEIPKHLQQADVFLLFSNYENLPCVILESFASGTPVISTNVGGISEFFPKDFGYLIAKNDKVELINKLTKIYNTPINIPKKMHNYSVINFSKESIAKQYTKLYLKALN